MRSAFGRFFGSQACRGLRLSASTHRRQVNTAFGTRAALMSLSQDESGQGLESEERQRVGLPRDHEYSQPRRVSPPSPTARRRTGHASEVNVAGGGVSEEYLQRFARGNQGSSVEYVQMSQDGAILERTPVRQSVSKPTGRRASKRKRQDEPSTHHRSSDPHLAPYGPLTRLSQATSPPENEEKEDRGQDQSELDCGDELRYTEVPPPQSRTHLPWYGVDWRPILGIGPYSTRTAKFWKITLNHDPLGLPPSLYSRLVHLRLKRQDQSVVHRCTPALMRMVRPVGRLLTITPMSKTMMLEDREGKQQARKLREWRQRALEAAANAAKESREMIERANSELKENKPRHQPTPPEDVETTKDEADISKLQPGKKSSSKHHKPRRKFEKPSARPP